MATGDVSVLRHPIFEEERTIQGSPTRCIFTNPSGSFIVSDPARRGRGDHLSAAYYATAGHVTAFSGDLFLKSGALL